MRGLKTTTLLGVVLVALAAYIFLVDNKKAPEDGPKKQKAWAVGADTITEFTIHTASGDTTRVQRGSGSWSVIEPVKAVADEASASAIAGALASLDIERVLDENPASLKDFGLDPARTTVSFKVGGDATEKRLLIGEKTPGSGELYAQTDRSKALVLIAGFLENTFNKGTFDLRDKAVLTFDRTKADRLELTNGTATLKFAKSGDVDWSMTAPLAIRGDFGAIDGALAALSATQVQTFVAEEAGRDLKRYGLDTPALTVTVGTGDKSVSLTIGGEAGGTRYARNSQTGVVFTVGNNLLTDLKKGPDDFRRKDLFDFRAFTGTRIELTHGTETLTLDKVKGKDETTPDAWKSQAGKSTEAMKAEESLIKVTGLRADSFVTAVPSALKTPDATITVKFDEGKKTESVRFFVKDADVFAVREGEPGAAKVTRTAYEEALKELTSLK